MTLSWQEYVISKVIYIPIKLGQTDLVLVYDHCSSVGLRMQYCKSLRPTVMICAALLTHIHTQTDGQTDTERGRERERERALSATPLTLSAELEIDRSVYLSVNWTTKV